MNYIKNACRSIYLFYSKGLHVQKPQLALQDLKDQEARANSKPGWSKNIWNAWAPEQLEMTETENVGAEKSSAITPAQVDETPTVIEAPHVHEADGITNEARVKHEVGAPATGTPPPVTAIDTKGTRKRARQDTTSSSEIVAKDRPLLIDNMELNPDTITIDGVIYDFGDNLFTPTSTPATNFFKGRRSVTVENLMFNTDGPIIQIPEYFPKMMVRKLYHPTDMTLVNRLIDRQCFPLSSIDLTNFSTHMAKMIRKHEVLRTSNSLFFSTIPRGLLNTFCALPNLWVAGICRIGSCEVFDFLNLIDVGIAQDWKKDMVRHFLIQDRTLMKLLHQVITELAIGIECDMTEAKMDYYDVDSDEEYADDEGNDTKFADPIAFRATDNLIICADFEIIQNYAQLFLSFCKREEI